MPKQATYYLGRVSKVNLTEAQFLDALRSPASVKARDYLWTFINHGVFENKNTLAFVYGELAKYVPSGGVEQVDETHHESRNVEVDRQLIGASPFVYIPEYSGLAYQHIWNKIEQKASCIISARLSLTHLGALLLARSSLLLSILGSSENSKLSSE